MTVVNGPRIGLIRSGGEGERWYPESQSLFRALDALLACSVLDKDLVTPPGSPADGDMYIVAASPTGAWTGHAKAIAYWDATAAAWFFYTPIEGFVAWVADEALGYRYHSGSWSVPAVGDASTLQTHPASDFVLASNVDTDGSLAANSDGKVPSQKAVKTYTDNLKAGLSWKAAVRAATTAAGTLATSFENGDAIDGVTLATGDRILIKNQAAPAENGIYVVNASGAPTRATDADTAAEVLQATVFVEEGTTLADTQWTCTTNAPITLNTTALTWIQSNAGASYTADESTVHLSGNQFSIKSGGVTGTEASNNLRDVRVPFIIDGGGSVITTGLKGGFRVPAGAIVEATLLALDGNTGSIVVDLWKDTYANHPPTVADTITASAKPTISSATKATDSTLTGWTTSTTAGDIVFVNVDSIATFTRVLLELVVRRS